MISKSNYIPGGYKRRELKGYLQYEKYRYKTIFIDTAKNTSIFKDSLMDLLYRENLLKKSSYLYYYDKLKDLFSDIEVFDNLSDEQVYYKIHLLRKGFFDANINNYLEKKRFEDLGKLMLKAKEILTFDELIKESIYYNVENEKRKLSSPINQYEILKNDIYASNEIVFIPGNFKQLPFLLFLSERYLKDKIIKILVKDESPDEEAVYKDLSFLGKYTDLCQIYSSKCAGIDLSNKIVERILIDANESSRLIVGLDENMLLTLDGATFDYYILSKIDNIKARRYTNIYVDSSSKISYVIARVKGKDIVTKRYSGVERSIGSLYHYTKKDKSYYMNFYSDTYNPARFKELKIKSETFPEIFIERDKKLTEITARILSNFNATYIDSYYTLDDLNKDTYIPEQNKNAVLVRGIYFKNISKIKLKPVLAQNLGTNLLYIRDIIKDKIVEKNGFYLNFLYFATSNIVYLYNKLRSQNTNEKLKFENFFIDYIYKQGFETFPLYNKAVITYTKDGKIAFENKKLASGLLSINGSKFEWHEDDVNSENMEKDIIIFTPYIKNEELSRMYVDFRTFTMNVGQGRYNIVIINNKIVCIRHGEVKQPSLGIVLSLNERVFNRLKKAFKILEIEDGYYNFDEKYSISLKLNKSKNSIWSFGGGTMLVQNGENLVKDKNEAFKSFLEEGWFHPLSMQTQETQVQEWVRGPRTVIGIDKSNGFFTAVFSGRTKESRGARFDEVVAILSKEIGELKNVMNLDGGASSCLALIYKNELFEISYPCTSDYTSSGMVRPVNSGLFIFS